MNISERAVIVTGGASGLGEATARALAEGGAAVVVADLNGEQGEAVAGQIGGRYVRCDVASEADAQHVVEAAIRSFGGVYGLVNCAGIGTAARTVGKNGPHDLPLFAKTIAVNPHRYVQHDPARERRGAEQRAG